MVGFKKFLIEMAARGEFELMHSEPHEITMFSLHPDKGINNIDIEELENLRKKNPKAYQDFMEEHGPHIRIHAVAKSRIKHTLTGKEYDVEHHIHINPGDDVNDFSLSMRNIGTVLPLQNPYESMRVHIPNYNRALKDALELHFTHNPDSHIKFFTTGERSTTILGRKRQGLSPDEGLSDQEKFKKQQALFRSFGYRVDRDEDSPDELFAGIIRNG